MKVYGVGNKRPQLSDLLSASSIEVNGTRFYWDRTNTPYTLYVSNAFIGSPEGKGLKVIDPLIALSAIAIGNENVDVKTGTRKNVVPITIKLGGSPVKVT